MDVLIIDSQCDQETIQWMMAVQNPCFYLKDPFTSGEN
jgi:hypothetical protein